MAYWILQAKPEVYDALAALGDADSLDRWRIARHRDDIAPGDEFALWISGRESGVYAFGVVTGPVVCDRDPDPFWQDPAEGSGLDWRVGIKIQERPEHPILRNDRRADPGFADAAILRMPGGGNPFPVTAAEWQILQSHRAPGASDGRAPSTSRGAPKISSGFFATISPSRPCTRTSARPRRTAPALHGV
jgi:EVE domain